MSLKHPTKMMKILKMVLTVETTETGHMRMNHLKEPMDVELQLITPEKAYGDVMNAVNICVILTLLKIIFFIFNNVRIIHIICNKFKYTNVSDNVA